MKRIILFLMLLNFSVAVLGQSISLNPASADEFTVTTYGSSTNSSLLGRKAGGTVSSPTATTFGTQLLLLGGRGHSGTGFNSASAAALTIVASQTFSTTASGTHMRFWTTDLNTTTAVERMRINHDGKIGVNTTNPLAQFHVTRGISGVTPNASSVAFLDDNANNYLGLASPDASETGILFGKPTLGATSGGIIYDNTNNLLLRTGGNNTRMAISSSGLVGIGTTTPTGKLQITHTGSDSEPHLRIQANTGALGRIGWSTATNANSWIAQTNLESATAASNYWRLEYNSASKLYINGDGKVGIGSDAPTAKLHVEGDFSLSKITNFPVNGGYNDTDRAGASILRFTNGGIINGIAGGADGMILYIFNTNSSTLTLSNQNTGSAAANRIITHTGGNFNLSTVGGVTLIYDGTTSRWRIVSVAQ